MRYKKFHKLLNYKLFGFLYFRANTFLFSSEYYNSIKSNNSIMVSKKEHLAMGTDAIYSKKNISTLSDWSEYQEYNGTQEVKDVINLIKINQQKLSNFLKNPTISYLANINSDYSMYDIGISNADVKGFNNIFSTIPNDVKEVNIILSTLGGLEIGSRKIVELIRKRFDVVNIIVPSVAHSAAAMICLSANKIILTPEASLSPFDVQIKYPSSNQYIPAKEMLEIANEAKKSFNPLCIFTSKKLYDGWDIKEIKRVTRLTKYSMKIVRLYPIYWLMKYMFNCFSKNDFELKAYLGIPFWKLLSSNGRKAKRIVDFFINTGVNFSHDEPIMFNDLEHSGLNIELADGEFLELLRENSLLTDVLFEISSITKIFISEDNYSMRYLVDKEK